jgi:hypothetical protein
MQIAEEKLTFYYNSNLPKPPIHHLIQTALHNRGGDLVDVYNEFLIDIYLLLDNLNSNYIAIDWDNTVSADPVFFIDLIKQFQTAGYIPFICTLRAPDRENIIEISSILNTQTISIFLTDGCDKRAYMLSMGVHVHLWIDDFYPSICRESCLLFKKNGVE